MLDDSTTLLRLYVRRFPAWFCPDAGLPERATGARVWRTYYPGDADRPPMPDGKGGTRLPPPDVPPFSM